MSKIPYTIDIDQTICSELAMIRKMNDTRDYSGLAAVVERIQYHANSMESALWRYKDKKYEIKDVLDSEKEPDVKLAEIKKVIDAK